MAPVLYCFIYIIVTVSDLFSYKMETKYIKATMGLARQITFCVAVVIWVPKFLLT